MQGEQHPPLQYRCSGPVPMQLAMELILTCLMPVEATPEELLCFVRGRGTPATSTSASRCFCELGDMSVSPLGTTVRTTSFLSYTFTLYRALEAADRAVGAHRANLPLSCVENAGPTQGARLLVLGWARHGRWCHDRAPSGARCAKAAIAFQPFVT